MTTRPTLAALLLLVLLLPAARGGPTAWTVEGVVTDPEARPIAGATVDAWEDQSVEAWGVPWSDTPVASATSGVDGRYRLRLTRAAELPPHGNYLLRLRAAGRDERRVWLEREVLEAERVAVHRVALRKTPEPSTAAPPPADDAPRSPLRVRVLHDGPTLPLEARVQGDEERLDHEGRCTLQVLAETTAVLIRSRDASWCWTEPRGAGPELVVRIPRLAPLRVSAVVVPPLDPAWAFAGTLEFRSDDGRFVHERRVGPAPTCTLSLPVGVPGVVSLRPWEFRGCGNGAAPTLVPTLRRAVVGGEPELTLQVHRGRVRARVRGATGIGRAAQVSVQLPDGETRASATSERGELVLLGVAAGEVRFVLTDGPDRAEATVTVGPGDEVAAPLTLP